ncbi:hypothetical protein [Streptomyces sp. NPDC054837]
MAANDPVEQEKDVKFTSLLANLVIFHNTLDIAEPLDVLGQVRGDLREVERFERAALGLQLADHVGEALHPRTRHHPRTPTTPAWTSTSACSATTRRRQRHGGQADAARKAIRGPRGIEPRLMGRSHRTGRVASPDAQP